MYEFNKWWAKQLEMARAKGWTMEALADELGVARNTLYTWRNMYKPEEPEIRDAICSFFGVHPATLAWLCSELPQTWEQAITVFEALPPAQRDRLLATAEKRPKAVGDNIPPFAPSAPGTEGTRRRRNVRSMSRGSRRSKGNIATGPYLKSAA